MPSSALTFAWFVVAVTMISGSKVGGDNGANAGEEGGAETAAEVVEE